MCLAFSRRLNLATFKSLSPNNSMKGWQESTQVTVSQFQRSSNPCQPYNLFLHTSPFKLALFQKKGVLKISQKKIPSFFRLLSFILRLLSLSFSLSFVINLSSLNSFPIGGSLRIAHLDYIMPKSATIS